MRRHCDECAIGQDEIFFRAEFLDAGKNVIPTPAIEPDRVIAQLVENLVHLKGRRDGFNEDGCTNRSARNSNLILHEIEDVVPYPRLDVALHFWQIKIWTGAAIDQLVGIMEEEQPEIEEAPNNRFSIDQNMFLVQVPTARPNE